MYNRNVFGIAACSILSVMVSASAFAAGMTGKVISIDPIEARQNDGTVKTLTLTPEQFNRWDDRGTITLFGDAESGCKCMTPSLGALEKPVSLQVEVQGVKYTLTIPAHRTILYNYQGTIQIDIKDVALGTIGVDQAGSSAQHDSIIAEYNSLRKTTVNLLGKLNGDVSSGNFQNARADYSKVVANELYSSDVSQLDQLFKSIPENERPIDTYTGDVRWEMKDMKKTFGGVDFDQMTKGEYVRFVNKWASTPATAKTEGDETYLFRFFDNVGVSKATQEELLIKTVETRLNKFVAQAKAGDNPRKDVIWNDEYNFEGAYNYLKYSESETAKAYIKGLHERVAKLDPSTQAFLKDIFMLSILFRD